MILLIIGSLINFYGILIVYSLFRKYKEEDAAKESRMPNVFIINCPNNRAGDQS
jgi:hypothetical protein